MAFKRVVSIWKGFWQDTHPEAPFSLDISQVDKSLISQDGRESFVLSLA